MTRELIMRAGFIARLSAAAKAVATLIVALGVVLVAAAAAQATQTPQLTLMINTQGGAGCGLLVPFGSSAALSASPCNGGPLSLTFPSPASAPVVTSSAPQPASSSPFALNPDLEFGPDVAQGSAGGGVPAGTAVGYQIDAPPGFTFTGMPALSQGPTSGVATGKGWGGATYWACSSTATVPASSKCPQGWRSQAPNKAGDEQQAAGQQNAATFPYGSGIWGVVMVCGWARCSNPARMTLNSVELTATETQTPTITPVGDNNLLDQAVPGRWVWNEPASPWNAAVSASDPSGICGISGSVNNNQVSDPSSATPVLSQWQQCPANPTWPLSIDTREYITGAGQLPITMSAQNAAEADSQIPAEPSASLPTQTVAVDNDPVNVVLTTPDDPNPTVWVNHAVTADVTASSGPSGLGSVVCAVDGGAPQSLPGAGGQTMNGQVTLNGDGVHVLICTASNTAVDPNGLHNTGTNSITVHIDQAGPSVSIEPVSEHPNDPTSVVADTSDSESGVAGGSIAMAPDGSSDWTSLPTTFSNGQLLAHFDDSSLAAGAWQLRARSCDNVGNCSTTTQALTLPLRSAATSNVSLQSINPECSAPATTGLRAVRPRSSGGVGLAADQRRARNARVTARVAVFRALACLTPAPLTSNATLDYGQPVTVHGVLMSSAGLPLAGQTVSVLAAPSSGLGAFTQAASVTTAPDGSWTTTLPAGPSRIIRASYAGSPTILPAAGEATVTVPARISVTATPRILPWTGVVTLRGHLEGGYIPPDGVAMYLMIKLPHRSRPYAPVTIRTDADGNFVFHWTWATGVGVATEPFAIATDATESDYPFAAAQSNWIPVTFGLATPRSHHQARKAKRNTKLRHDAVKRRRTMRRRSKRQHGAKRRHRHHRR